MTPDAKTLGRRIGIALAALGGVAVVIISWRVPEPQPPSNPRVENMSYLKYAPQTELAPSYGTR